MRTRMVTRTVKFNEVECMAVNTNPEVPEIIKISVSVSGSLEGKALEKTVKNLVESREGIKYVSITGMTATEQIYGMPEEEFLKYAKIVER